MRFVKFFNRPISVAIDPLAYDNFKDTTNPSLHIICGQTHCRAELRHELLSLGSPTEVVGSNVGLVVVVVDFDFLDDFDVKEDGAGVINGVEDFFKDLLAYGVFASLLSLLASL